MGQFDLPRSPATSLQMAQMAPLMPVVPIRPEIFKDPDHRGLEDLVDQFIATNKLRSGDSFQIPYPEGTKTFEYLGPESGGRKDWMEKEPPAAAPLTS